MRILLAAAIWAALCVAASAAPGNPTQVFGVTLGAPLSLPDCSSNPSAECTDTLGVHFADGQRPVWVHFGFFSVDATDGTVGKIEVFTQGIEVQELVMAELTAKFGKPTASKIDHEQNGYGARFDVIQAIWKRADGEVSFVGAIDSETGDITVKSNAYIAEEQREQSAGAHL
jgi:hypothetical protein